MSPSVRRNRRPPASSPSSSLPARWNTPSWFPHPPRCLPRSNSLRRTRERRSASTSWNREKMRSSCMTIFRNRRSRIASSRYFFAARPAAKRTRATFSTSTRAFLSVPQNSRKKKAAGRSPRSPSSRHRKTTSPPTSRPT